MATTGPGGHRRAKGVPEQLRDPSHGDVLAHHEVVNVRPQAGAVAGRSGRLGRERSARLGPAIAASLLGHVLGGYERGGRQVEHLTADNVGQRR